MVGFLWQQKAATAKYKHPVKLGRVTIAGKSGDDMAAGTLNSVFKQAK